MFRLSRMPQLARYMIAALLVLFSLVAYRQLSHRHQVLIQSIEIHGLSREYRLVIPARKTDQRRRPLLVAFHGALDTTAEMAAYTGLDELAAQEQFLLVYPQGRHLNWPPLIPAENPEVMEPDLQLFRAICDRMVEEYSADPRRIYVLGVSQGGAMANVVTAFCSDRIAASLCNCGWLPQPLEATPLKTAYKCPLLFVVGADDQQVTPELTRVAHDAFQAAGHPVEFLTIPHHGHGWPREHHINAIAWQFFSLHAQPAATPP